MTLQQLRYFVEIARCRNFTRAAQRLAIAQPALSQSIAALEGELDAKLFQRHPRGVDLTDAGQRLFDQGRGGAYLLVERIALLLQFLLRLCMARDHQQQCRKHRHEAWQWARASGHTSQVS